MSSRRHQIKRSKLRRDKRKKTKQVPKRRPRNSPLVDSRPQQSKLSRRWISEAQDKGRCAKLEAIYTIQKEAENGKDVNVSMEKLAKLIADPDKDVSLSAAWAVGECAARGTNPMAAIPQLIGLLHSKDDLTVGTAIESLGECAKNLNSFSRKIFVKKLSLLNKNGASDETKADAGFALAEAFSSADDLAQVKEFRRAAKAIFIKLAKSTNDTCRVAGVIGLASISISLAKAPKTSKMDGDPIYYLNLFPLIGNELVFDVVKQTFAILEKLLPDRIKELYSVAIRMLAGAGNFDCIIAAGDILHDGLAISENRLYIINNLAVWEVSSKTALSQVTMVMEAKKLIERNIHPLKVFDHMSFENNEQREWLENTLRAALEINALNLLFKNYHYSEFQLDLVAAKIRAMNSLREEGIQTAKQAGEKLTTRYLEGNDYNTLIR